MAVAPRLIGNALVSTNAPFRFLDISRGLSELIEYQTQEAVSRTVNLLFGPESNTKNFSSTIKQVADDDEHKPKSIRSLKIYSKSGRMYLVDVTFTPLMHMNGYELSCCLTFKWPAEDYEN